MVLWVASNSKPTRAGLHNKERASSGTIRGGVRAEMVSEEINVANKDLCSVCLSTSSVITRELPWFQTLHIYQAMGENAF